MRFPLAALLVPLFLGFPPMVLAQSHRPIMGTAHAQDGDSLEIGGVRIRLHGIDAPEFDQWCKSGQREWHCGAEAADKLSTLVTGREVRCANLGKDQFDRVLGRCTVNGLDVNRAMVETGHALAYRKYSADYVASEERAKAANLGIWAGTFENPADVRAANRQGDGRGSGQSSPRRHASADQAATGNCRIKGNNSRRGGKIYHLPGMPYYAQTVAEQMFCTEAEARAAGYRRSRADQRR